MKIFKFVIRNHEWVHSPDDPAISYKGCVAAVVAETPEVARERLERYAAENGFDPRWLKVAKVVELPFNEGTVIAWALV